MKRSRILAASVAVLALAACTPKAHISGKVEQAPDSRIVLKQLNVNAFDVVDTLKTDASGAFRCAVKVEEGQPEFFYLFHGDTRIAALLLEKGEKAVVTADTLGNYSVEGSKGTDVLMEAEKMSADFVRLVAAEDDPKVLTKAFVDYYRSRVKFVLANSHSLAVVPVLTEQLDANIPVFNQLTDALHFRNVCDSLRTVYPDSKYLKALEKEATRRENYMKLHLRVNAADALSYPELNLPDVNGERKLLSEVGAKVTLLHFWNPADATHKMMNLEVLLPVYNEFHAKGLEIYSVAVDVDKAEWAGVVRAQKLPWINVNDGLGSASPALIAYNITQVPTSFLIYEDGLTAPAVSGVDGLRSELAKLLK